MNKGWLRPVPVEPALALLWLLVQAVLLGRYGVHTELEAEKYTHGAAVFAATGAFPAPKYIFYSTMILLIALFNKTGLGYLGVVLFQIAFNGLATLLLYRLARGVTGLRAVARLTTLLFILFFPLQLWNVYLYTESVFISLTLLYSYLVYRYPPRNFPQFLIHLPALALLCLTRPFGLLFVLPFLLYAIFLARKGFRIFLISATLAGAAVCLYLVNYAFMGGEDMDVMKPFKEEHTICFLAHPNPARLNLANGGSAVYQLGYYLLHNPLHFLQLCGRRLYAFFSLVRPYYSTGHNLYLLLAIVPVYGFLLVALFRSGRVLRHPWFRFILLTVAFYALAVTFQCDDYHNRFIMPLAAFLFLLAARGFYFCFPPAERPPNAPATPS